MARKHDRSNKVLLRLNYNDVTRPDAGVRITQTTSSRRGIDPILALKACYFLQNLPRFHVQMLLREIGHIGIVRERVARVQQPQAPNNARDTAYGLNMPVLTADQTRNPSQ